MSVTCLVRVQPADMAFLFANQALASPTSLIFDPFVGTGSLLIAAAHFGATVIGADIDWKILHGLTPGGRARKADAEEVKEAPPASQLRVEDNFRHYGLPLPELLCADQSRVVWEREEVFDAIVTDPPYGVRAGARKSGRKGEVREVGSEYDGIHIPPSQLYEVEDVVDDLLDMAAKTLKRGGRLVYLLPTTTESAHPLQLSLHPIHRPCHVSSDKCCVVLRSFTVDELPRHPCLRLLSASEQIVRNFFSRRLITMEKHRAWSPQLNIARRDKDTQPPPKYNNLKAALLRASATAPHPHTLDHTPTQPDDDNPTEGVAAHPQRTQLPSRRKQRKVERFVRRREHKEHVRLHGQQYGLDSFPPDAVLFFNATIYASASSFSFPYTWMVISGDRVLRLGRSLPPLSAIAAAERKRNLQGRVILPGLIDSHCHVYFTGKLMTTVDFSACDSIASFQSTLRAYLASHPPPSTAYSPTPHWVVGNKWEQDRLGRYPTAADVDAVVPDHPTFCWRMCYHVAVVNSMALHLAGVTRDTPDPPGGSIDRDERGEPTGLLRETAAQAVVRLIVESGETKKEYVRKGLEHFLSFGVTAVQTNDEACWPVYKQLADGGLLPLRVQLTIMHKEMEQEGQPKAGDTYGPLLSCHRIKLFADGALGAETAALSQPYVHRCAHPPSSSSTSSTHSHAANDSGTDDSGNRGILIHSQSDLNAAVRRATELGYRVEMHVIGDMAAQVGVQSFIDAPVPPVGRPILTHCQVLSASLLTSFAARNVVANIQPQFLTTDARWLNDRLPPPLLTHAYAWRSLLAAGVHCAGGSDSPIEEPSPWEGMHAAVFRPMKQYAEMRGDREGWERARREGGEEGVKEWYGGCWKEEERLDVRQALELYTTGGAYCGGVEGEVGELRDGLLADFVVVDCDVIQDPHRLLFAKAEEVWVGGVRRR